MAMMMDLVQVAAQVCDENINTNKTVNSGNKKRLKIEREGSTSIPHPHISFLTILV